MSALLPKGSAVRKAALVGLGKQEGFSTSGATKWGTALATIAKEQKAKAAAALVPSLGGEPLSPALQSAALTATLLGLSPDLRYKSSADPEALKKPPLATLDLLGGADMDAARKVGPEYGMVWGVRGGASLNRLIASFALPLTGDVSGSGHPDDAWTGRLPRQLPHPHRYGRGGNSHRGDVKGRRPYHPGERQPPTPPPPPNRGGAERQHPPPPTVVAPA